MSQKLLLKNSGLQTNSNQLSEVSEGALTLANNCVIDKDGVAESRRGFTTLPSSLSIGSDVVDRLTSYQEAIIARTSGNVMAYRFGGVWTSYSGSYSHPDVDLARMQFLQAAGNLYFTTSAGVKVLDNYAGPIYSTGMPAGLDGVASTTGGSGFMTSNEQRAYRVVWGSRDVNNNLYLGAPSQRYIVSNAAGTRDVSLTSTIPSGITVNDFFQVYRSKASASSTTEPNDELQLVYEANPTAGEITAKSFTFTDSTPDSLMGAFLYTNDSQEGIAEENNEPPLAQDIALFKNYTFFGNVVNKENIKIKLLAVSGTGLVLNDTITVDGMVFTAKATEAIASREFKLSTGGSAAQNIEDTSKSLIKVINQYTSNTTVYAYYLSGYQDLPGQIQIESRSLGAAGFTVSTSRPLAFDLGTEASSNDEYVNGLMWSKESQSEHVPASHLAFVGSKNYPIRRIVALRDSLFILKEDGVFRLTGSGGSWSIDPLDTSTRIIAPDSASVVNNQIFCLADQGIVAISDIGVQVMSRPIEDILTQIRSESFTNMKYYSYGLGYDTDRKYILNTITYASDTNCTRSLVYNTFTQAWTNWTKESQHGFVNEADDKLYLSSPVNSAVLQERKSFDNTDYADEELTTFSIASSSGYNVVLNSIVGLDVGYVLYQDSSTYSIITAIDGGSMTVTVHDLITWNVGATTILKGIECELEYSNQHFQNPGIMKHFQEVALLFRDVAFVSGTVSFYTDLSGGYSDKSFSGYFGGAAWGQFAWGTPNWGSLQRPKPIRVFVPREKSRGSLVSVKITMKDGFSKWSLNGVSFQYEWVSEKMSRS